MYLTLSGYNTRSVRYIRVRNVENIPNSEHSGVYVCNDNDNDITITNSDASQFAELILLVCSKKTSSSGISGQAFTSDQGGYVRRAMPAITVPTNLGYLQNVVVGFCDGQQNPSPPPSAYTPPGPNGDAEITCGGNGPDPCLFTTCDPSTLSVATSVNVSTLPSATSGIIGLIIF